MMIRLTKISLNGEWRFLYLDATGAFTGGFQTPGAAEGWIRLTSLLYGSFAGTTICTIQMFYICSL